MGHISAAFVWGSVACVYRSPVSASRQSVCTIGKSAFMSSPRAVGTSGWTSNHLRRIQRCSAAPAKWKAFMGGGFMGVGPSEMVVVLVVGWLVLGPQKLLSLSRDVGRVVGDLKKSADEASSTFREALEVDALNKEIEEAEAKLRSTTASDGKSESTVGSTAATAVGSVSADGKLEAGGVATKPKGGVETAVKPKSDSGEDEHHSGAADTLKDVADAIEAAPAAVGLETPGVTARVVSDMSAGGSSEDVADRTIPTSSGLPDLEMPGPDGRENDSAARTRARFLDQLNRAQDPNQRSEADELLDDEDALTEDVEVARLEYELAKARLAAKKRRESETLNKGKNGTGP